MSIHYDEGVQKGSFVFYSKKRVNRTTTGKKHVGVYADKSPVVIFSRDIEVLKFLQQLSKILQSVTPFSIQARRHLESAHRQIELRRYPDHGVTRPHPKNSEVLPGYIYLGADLHHIIQDPQHHPTTTLQQHLYQHHLLYTTAYNPRTHNKRLD